MKCKYCGREAMLTLDFCGYCSNKLKLVRQLRKECDVIKTLTAKKEDPKPRTKSQPITAGLKFEEDRERRAAAWR